MEIPLYLCDPVKNTECTASINGVCTSEECHSTSKIACAVLDECGKPIVTALIPECGYPMECAEISPYRTKYYSGC